MKEIMLLILALTMAFFTGDAFAAKKPHPPKAPNSVKKKVPPPPGLKLKKGTGKADIRGPNHHAKHPAPPSHHDKHHHDKHHHDKKSSSSSFWGGFVGGVIGSALFGSHEPPPPPPPAGHYEVRNQQVWVEGAWVYMTDAFGVRQRVWQPGHYETQPVQVWVAH